MTANWTTYQFRPTRFTDEFIHAIPSEATHLLHLGCGDGQQSAAFSAAETRIKVIGVDRNVEYCKRAAEHLDQVFHLDIQNAIPPLAPGSMDCLLFDDLIEHLEFPDEVLQRLSKLLKPRGCIVARVTCSPYGPLTNYQWTSSQVAPEIRVCKVTWKFSYDFLRSIFAAAGMEVEVLHRIPTADCDGEQLTIRARFSDLFIPR